jgi:hypothetical protein
MVRRHCEQTAVVGIATHYAVEGHHIGDWDRSGHFPEIAVLERHAVGVA